MLPDELVQPLLDEGALSLVVQVAPVMGQCAVMTMPSLSLDVPTSGPADSAACAGGDRAVGNRDHDASAIGAPAGARSASGSGTAYSDEPTTADLLLDRSALATAPGVYEPSWTTSSSAWVKVSLELADPEEVFELLEEAWRMTATKRAIKAYEASGLLSSNLQSATTRGPAHS
jgi:hypothetical protein